MEFTLESNKIIKMLKNKQSELLTGELSRISNFNTITESVSTYNGKFGEFNIDDGLLKMFTYNKELCDFVDVSIYNQTVYKKYLHLIKKSRKVFYHSDISYYSMAESTLRYSRLRNLIHKIASNVSNYNSLQETMPVTIEMFTAKNKTYVCGNTDNHPLDCGYSMDVGYSRVQHIVGKLIITPKKVKLIWEDLKSEERELIFKLPNDRSLVMEMTILAQTELMEATWSGLPMNIGMYNY